MRKKLLPGIWYGELSSLSVEELHHQLNQSVDQVEIVLVLAELLKKGELSAKARLIRLMNETKRDEVLDLCVRLFCSVCTHGDLRNRDNLRFLDHASEDIIFTFVTGAVETMSYEVIPYLFEIWEDWEGVDRDIDDAIIDGLNSFLNDGVLLSDEPSLSDFTGFYRLARQEIDSSKYYYKGGVVYPGNFTKELVNSLLESASQQRKSNSYLQVSLLSIFTGKRVPLTIDKIVDESDIQSVYQYVDSLARTEWKQGMKYFYGFPVER